MVRSSGPDHRQSLVSPQTQVVGPLDPVTTLSLEEPEHTAASSASPPTSDGCNTPAAGCCIRRPDAVIHPETMHYPLSMQASISTLNIPFIPAFNK